ncbi:quinone oxidoreductase family protein [Sphingobium yanoikuyae]|uniref:quinone oxidoreductase family protein n=1 Tax=Sphingobium yanoikuyae TaxID=13690 RepID=UPI0022DD611F|nr:quinone oxidoreductase [Sphingobium yanoikuyae]WBQ15874.1 quinone oxidoreductase [Sphingobium yanoikuyae]
MIVRAHGGPEAIECESFDPGTPGEGEVLIAQDAVGLNFIDTYYRTGLYPAPLPLTLGSEGAGHVVAVGAGVSGIAVGDKVGCAAGLGAYATHRIVPADRVVRIPDAVSTRDAAAMMLKGMTACYLAEDMIDLLPGDVALVHAAAGGVGSVLVPWLRDKGVVVIAHSGSPEKAARVDADHSLSGPLDDLAAQVRDLTSGKGVAVAYDGVGKDSWAASLASLRRRGLLVSYGNASGAVPPISLLDLSRNGSLYVSRPTLFDYVATAEDLTNTAERLFDRMARGIVSAQIGQSFALADAADAHRALEGRQTTGSTILIP